MSTDENEIIEFLVIYNKERFQIQFPAFKTIFNLKEHLQTLTNIPPGMQKIMFKGLAKDECTLKELNIKKNDKLMLIGSKLEDVAQANSKPTSADLANIKLSVENASKVKLSEETAHKKVLDKHGKPDDVLPGILNLKESLPEYPLSGMLNKAGHKVRLTFKLETDELWIGTKERTDKLPMSSIKSVVSEPIVGHEEYHIMGIQIGPTEASRYWIYWVPAQYVQAIRSTLLS